MRRSGRSVKARKRYEDEETDEHEDSQEEEDQEHTESLPAPKKRDVRAERRPASPAEPTEIVLPSFDTEPSSTTAAASPSPSVYGEQRDEATAEEPTAPKVQKSIKQSRSKFARLLLATHSHLTPFSHQ